MSAPPGSNSQSNSGRSTPANTSLPPRPPPSAVSQPARSAFSAFKPRSVAAPAPPRPAPSPAPAAYDGYPASTYAPSYPGYQTAEPPQSYPQPSYPAGQSYYPQAYGAGYPAQNQYADEAPQIKNPFAPPPSSRGGPTGSLYGNSFDPEHEAQVQQWQQAYATPRDNSGAGPIGRSGKGDGAASAGGANAIPLGAVRAQASTPTVAATAETASAPPVDTSGKKTTVVRSGGGKSWEDPTLLEWGDHPRLFVGNLAGEVTDESLLKAFAKYPSVQKARVIRDKRTTKSKGFGFVSLANTDEFFQAAKDMQGKYIGSHPVLIKRAEAEIKAVVKKDHDKYKNKNKNKNKNNDKSKDESNVLGANTGAGVQKKQTKAAGGYKVLG
ncbi:hypothetical protein MBLNU459_g2710t1 [Dothideomycetes sp. NU459]